MTICERKLMIVGAIRKLEDRLCALKYCEYDGVKTLGERDAEIEVLQEHLRCAHAVLVLINEEELGLRSA
jgi:hypothetical protein